MLGGARLLNPNEVTVNTCEKGRCKLRRKTDAVIELKVTPEEDIEKLTTTVYAEILSVPLPFIGVDGTSACENMFLEDGVTKTDCPLKAGQTYVYKNKFPILEIYPKLQLVVHWALTSNGKDVVCFEVPAKIV